MPTKKLEVGGITISNLPRKKQYKKELATARTRTYPSDHIELTLMAKKRGGKTLPADIIHELLQKNKNSK